MTQMGISMSCTYVRGIRIVEVMYIIPDSLIPLYHALYTDGDKTKIIYEMGQCLGSDWMLRYC